VPTTDGPGETDETLPVSTAPSMLDGTSIDCTITVVPVVGTAGDNRQVDLSIESNQPGITVYVALEWDDGGRRFEAPLSSDGTARGRLDVPGVGAVSARVHSTPQFRPGDVACSNA